MYDLTINNLLPNVPNCIPGLQRPQAYPYLTDEGDVYALVNFEQCAQFAGHSMLDWEPNALSSYAVGTAAVVNGNVTVTGGTLPEYSGHSVYSRRFYANNTLYEVAHWVDATHLTLRDLTVNISAGTPYRFASWDYRETDPQYAVPGEWQAAHDEWAIPMAQVESMARANSARIGIYDFLVHTYRRPNDILVDYATWQDQVEEVVNYVTSSGFTIADYVRRNGGKVWWTAYVPLEYLSSTQRMADWRLRNRRIMETCRALKLPNAPIFRRQVVETVNGVWVPDSFMLECMQDAEEYQPGEWGFWGTSDEFTAPYASFISDYTSTLPNGQATIRHLLRSE